MSEWVRDIYDWHKGYDDDDVKILTHLNNIINGIYEIEGYGWDCIFHRLNVMKAYQESILCELEDFDLCDMAIKLEVIRTLLIGGKVDYNFLGEHLAKGVTEYGYIVPEKEKV